MKYSISIITEVWKDIGRERKWTQDMKKCNNFNYCKRKTGYQFVIRVQLIYLSF